MNRTTFLLLLFSFFNVWSCSVKEDRLSCPSSISVDVSLFMENSAEVVAGLLTDIRHLRDTVGLEDGLASMEWSVDKGTMAVYAFSNLYGNLEDDGTVAVPPGCRAAPLMTFAGSFDCYEESLHVKAVPNRQSAFVHLRIHGAPEDYPYTLQISSDVCGINLRTLAPAEGKFLHDLEFDENLSCRFYLPRQKDDSKPVINVLSEGIQVDVLPLHEWLRNIGYDWTRDDLPDIHIDIYHGMLKIFVTVQGWEHEEYEIIL